MKLTVFVALALVATGVSAQDIEVKSELRLNGKVIEQFTGTKPNGQTQIFSSLKSIPYTKAATQIEGGKVKTTKSYYQTGFYMEILPTLNNDGTIQYVMSVRQQNLIELVPHKVGDMEVESPTVSDDSFVRSVVAEQGEATESSMTSYEGDSPKHYVLTVAVTAPKN